MKTMKNFILILAFIFGLTLTSCSKYDDFLLEQNNQITKVDTTKYQPTEYKYRVHVTEEISIDSLFYNYYYRTTEIEDCNNYQGWRLKNIIKRRDTLLLGTDIKFTIDYYVDTLTTTELDKYSITSIPNKFKTFSKKITLSSDHNIRQDIIDCLTLVIEKYTFNPPVYQWQYTEDIKNFEIQWDKHTEYHIDGRYLKSDCTYPTKKLTYYYFRPERIINQFYENSIKPNIINIDLTPINIK